MPSLKQNVLTCKWNFDKKTKYYYIYKKKDIIFPFCVSLMLCRRQNTRNWIKNEKNCLMRNDDVAAQLCTKVKLTKATRARVLHLTFHSQESWSRQGPYCCRPVRMGKVGQQQVWYCDRDWRFSIEEHKEERREVVEYSKLRIWLWNETVESCQQHGIFFFVCKSCRRSQTVHCCSIRVGVLVNTYCHGSDWPWQQTSFKL